MLQPPMHENIEWAVQNIRAWAYKLESDSLSGQICFYHNKVILWREVTLAISETSKRVSFPCLQRTIQTFAALVA